VSHRDAGFTKGRGQAPLDGWDKLKLRESVNVWGYRAEAKTPPQGPQFHCSFQKIYPLSTVPSESWLKAGHWSKRPSWGVKISKPGVVVHTCNPNTLRSLRQEDHEFKTNLGCMVDRVSKNNKRL
jgi:hypothetical protein